MLAQTILLTRSTKRMLGMSLTSAAGAFAAAAMLLPYPAQAQEVEELQAIDDARLSLAGEVIDQLWPLGTYRRMMDGTMSQMMNAMFSTMFDMRAADFAPNGEDADVGDRTMAEIMEERDPHFRERMSITTDVMFREMLPLMDAVEPNIREAMTASYARKFSGQQLSDMKTFFATETGQAYAEQWMMSFVDPEIMKSMQSFAPQMMRAMPDIMQKVEEATAHLPPPITPESSEE